MENKLIYIADDEIKIQELIKMFLKKEGYNVEMFSDGETLLKAFKEKEADMLLLDIMMPNMDGLAVCTEIRKSSNVPIIIISAKDGEADKIAGLMLGSDDYMTKPFSPVELVLRVKSIFKRIEAYKKPILNEEDIIIGDLIIHLAGRYASCNEKDLKFTPMELSLLQYLSKNKNKGVSREELLNKVWGFDSDVDTRATDDMIKRIRKKLLVAGSNLMIETLWGFGFMISDKRDEINDRV
jgi:two-component system OmpR family response regulator